MSKRSLTVLSVAGAVLLIGFQNCGQAGFSSADSGTPSQNPHPPGATGTIHVNNTIPNTLCSAGQGPSSPQQYFPASCLLNPHLPNDAIGFEMNQLTSQRLTIGANDQAQGTGAAKILYLEIATYAAPDSIVVTAQTPAGEVALLNICNISTMNAGDPTGGVQRPPSNTILQFGVTIPKGTLALNFDLTKAATPTYIGAWNLQDFSNALAEPRTNPFYGTTGAPKFRVRSAPLSRYNDPASPQVCRD